MKGFIPPLKVLVGGFTLIEVLIVIAIIGILGAVLVVVMNPTELLRQSRDSSRLSDLNTLNKSLTLFEFDQTSGFMGTSSVVYVSIPDSSATCANLGLPGLPSGWSYNCVTSDNLKKVGGNGWVPVNFTSMSFPSPLARLPVDPTNTTSSQNYYTYVTGGSYELTAVMEAAKNKNGGAKDRVSSDGGDDAFAYEAGSDVALNPWKALPITDGLKVWLEAASITTLSDGEEVNTWTDVSGNGNTVTQGAATFYPLFKTNILNGWPVLRFDGNDRLEKLSAIGSGFSNATLFVVFTVSDDTNYSVVETLTQDTYWRFSGGGAGYFGPFTNGRFEAWPASMPSSGNYLFSVVAGNPYEVFQNGTSKGTQSSYTFDIGNRLYVGYQPTNGKWLTGDIAEVIIYGSALSAADRQSVESYLNSKYAIY